MEVEVGTQILNANLYPPCPKPELAMGLPPHADFGFLTLLVQNEIHGLEVLHKGEWISVNPPPNSFLVFAGIHLEVTYFLSIGTP